MNIGKLIPTVFAALVLAVTPFLSLDAQAQSSSGAYDIDRNISGTTKPYPVNISGLSGEALKILQFDLEVGGCDIVSKDNADYLVTASNKENIIGKLTDKTGSIRFFNRSYKNGTTRTQVHALAADIIKALTGADSIFGMKIAYCINTATDKNEVYIADFDGSNPHKLTNDGSMIRGLTWGPDNESLFFCSYRAGNPDIYRQDLRTGKRTRIAGYLGLNTSPAISPDGKKIAMILSKGGSPDLYVANIDGTNLKQLTHTKGDESSPCWSPDGTKICFSSRQSGASRLYVIPAAGGQMKQLKTSGVGSATEPDWSPDGKSSAFTTTTRSSFQICVVPSQGGEVEVLAEGASPNWASNSRTLIFSKKSGKKSSLVMLDVPTKKSKIIGSVTGSATQPCWTR